MSTKDKIKCKALVIKIKNGAYGEWSEETQENILENVKNEYELSQEMLDYIIVLMNENKK